MRYSTCWTRGEVMATLTPMSSSATRPFRASTPSSPPAARAPASGRCRARGTPKFLLDLTGTGRTLLQGDRSTGCGRSRATRRPGGHRRAARRGRGRAAARARRGAGARRAVAARLDGRDRPGRRGAAGAARRRRRARVVRRRPRDLGQRRVRGDGPRGRRRGAGRVRRHHRHPRRPSRPPPSGTSGPGQSLGLDDAPRAQHVAGFTEKPDAETAAEYLADGRVPLERRHVHRQGPRAARPPRGPAARARRGPASRSPPRGTVRTGRPCWTASGRA